VLVLEVALEVALEIEAATTVLYWAWESLSLFVGLYKSSIK
jgi:hypothetical protein